jgi:hypothetical protein
MRKLDDIIPPSRRRESEPMHVAVHNEPSEESEPKRSSVPTFIAILIVIAACIGGLFYFSTTKVKVTPATLSAAVQESFTATHSTGTLPYEVLVAEKYASQNVKGTGTKEVTAFASGTITIYNTQSKAQKLIDKTRFATPTGLIFRIRTAVTIPAGSATKPGSVTATVYADKAGADYNVGATTFTVPGFAGTPQAKQVYAESTSAMTGGASGMMPTVDATLEKDTRSALKSALERDLKVSIDAQIPTGYVLVPGSISFAYQDVAPTASATAGSVEIREQGSLTAVVFPNVALAKTIAGSITSFEYQNEPLTLSSVEGLTLTATPRLPDAKATSFTFTLSGTAQMVYTVDPTRIGAAISGKTRLEAKTALQNYPEVDQAVITLRPFWRKVLPEDPAQIEVSVDGL